MLQIEPEWLNKISGGAKLLHVTLEVPDSRQQGFGNLLGSFLMRRLTVQKLGQDMLNDPSFFAAIRVSEVNLQIESL